MHSIIQILKLNDPKTGTSAKTGKPYDMRDCECILLNEDGTVGQVGVLQIPKALRDIADVGTFHGTFALQADFQTRKIGAILTGLTPRPGPTQRSASAVAPAAPAARA